MAEQLSDMETRHMPRVVALCGSLRDASKTRVALDAALRAAAEADADTRLVDLRECDLPTFDPDDPEPSDVGELRNRVASADAVLLGTPNYHGSYTGTLKNALDYLGRDEFEGTTVGLLEVAGGSHPGPALTHLRAVCRTLNAWTLPTEVAIPNAHATVGADGIREDGIARRVRQLGEDLVAYAGVDRYPDVSDACVEATTGD